jgi:hypothetical protein
MSEAWTWLERAAWRPLEPAEEDKLLEATHIILSIFEVEPGPDRAAIFDQGARILEMLATGARMKSE